MHTHICDIETQWSGPRSIAFQGSPWWLSAPTETPENPAILEEIEFDCPEVLVAESDPAEFDENEYFWEQIADRDLVYLACFRKNVPAPCPWCGGRTTHNPRCNELRASWEVVMPFGRHKGKPLSQVPADYLDWLRRNGESLDMDLRDAIDSHLGESA
jgi:hypothetical protein